MVTAPAVKQRVSVGIGLRDILRGDGAVDARLALDRDGLGERALHLVRDQSRGAVGVAGGECNDQPYRPARIILRMSKRAGKNDKRWNERA